MKKTKRKATITLVIDVVEEDFDIDFHDDDEAPSRNVDSTVRGIEMGICKNVPLWGGTLVRREVVYSKVPVSDEE